jgi:hypothetical protein
MRGATLLATAFGGAIVLLTTTDASAGAADQASAPAVSRIAAPAFGSIAGVVQDERGAPVEGAVVSALGASTTFAVSDRSGRFEVGPLTPGPYLLRAHLSGFTAPRPHLVQVRPSRQATSAIALRRADSVGPLLAAAIGTTGTAEPDAAPPQEPVPSASGRTENDHGETAWRVRHARRSVLKDVRAPAALIEDPEVDTGRAGLPAGSAGIVSWAVGSPARLATNFFAGTPFSGQVNLLTTGTFDSPLQLFSASTFGPRIAYARVGAPVGADADWTIRGAVNQADLSSWLVAGSYRTRARARHRRDVGLSYATQRYDGGNPLALRDVSDGSRNAGTVYAYDSFAVSPVFTLTYGGSYARYDYVEGHGLFSPRVELAIAPTNGTRVAAALSRREIAPGAEEFLPPGDAGIWLPPQRTFSSVESGRPFSPERLTQASLSFEQDFRASTLVIRAFHQDVSGQLVTLFGADLPGQPTAKLGHYFVGNAGRASANGCGAEFRTVLANRVHGSVAYSFARARLVPADDLHYLLLMAPSAVRPTPERLHDLSTSVETNVPETSTRVLVLYRVSNGFARPATGGETAAVPALDGRFDVQVRQSLPFMNFTSARWEMLLAVRNFFRDVVPDQSVYDELLAIRPPKRLVGGVTLHF